MNLSRKQKPSPLKKIKLNKPLIYLITEGTLTAENFFEKKQRVLKLIEAAVENKISLIQIREKNLPARLVFDLTSKAAKITADSQTKLLVNDRADIARGTSADGVHLTENSVSAKIIRQNFPKKFIIGVSAHSLEKALIAKEQGADFATFSPVFHSPGKSAAQGLQRILEIQEKLKPFPVIALGGIDETNYKSVLQVGISGFAAIRFLNDDDNLNLIGRELFDTEN